MKFYLSTLLIAGLFFCQNLFGSDIAKQTEKRVNAIIDFQKKAFKPKSHDDYVRLRKEFDINEYFKILTKIKIKTSYYFDYFLTGDSYGSYPILLALNDEDKKFFKYLENLKNKPTEDTIKIIQNKIKEISEENCTKNKEYPDLPQSMSSENCIGYLKFLEVENSIEGYLDFIILRIMGNQFLLDWHANYNDRKIVATKESLELLVKHDLSASVTENIKDEDLEPKVEINGNLIKIKVDIFTKWGGLIEINYLIENNNFIQIKEVKEKVIIKYDCGIDF